MWMNEWEVREAQEWFTYDAQPNLQKGAQALLRLMEWTNGRSDGWAYWPVPSKAAYKLMDELHTARGIQRRGDEIDVSDAKLAGLLRPVRAMLRKQGEEETDKVLFPTPTQRPAPFAITVYMTGDKDGPNQSGLVYDDEDAGLECAFENGLHLWKLQGLLLPETKSLVHEPHTEGGDEDGDGSVD